MSVPTGTFTFYDGNNAIGTAPVNGSGQATLSAGFASPGTHQLSAAYSGDANFAPSTSANVLQNVKAAPTGSTLSTSPNPSLPNQQVALTAVVTAS